MQLIQYVCQAILEDCTGVRVAPYSWSYESIEGDFVTASLDRKVNHWDQVSADKGGAGDDNVILL